MGLERGERHALGTLVESIWGPRPYKPIAKSDGYRDEYEPITAMGFEPAHEYDSIRIDTGQDSSFSTSRWWYECKGQRYFFECLEEPPNTRHLGSN
jgi:hypothetical protein